MHKWRSKRQSACSWTTYVGPTGSLNNEGLLRAILQARNTPDPDCNISPTQVVFGRPIRDAFPPGAGQLRPILGDGRWLLASIFEEQAFLVEVLLTISDYWRSPVPLAPVVRPSNHGCMTITKQRVSQMTTSLPQLEQQQKGRLSTPQLNTVPLSGAEAHTLRRLTSQSTALCGPYLVVSSRLLCFSSLS